MLPPLSKATKLDHSIGRLPITTRSRAICIRICSSSPFRGIFYLSRLVTPGYCIFDFGGTPASLCWRLRHRIKAYVEFCWNAAELPAVSFFEARVL